jgi:hypothetical protein
VYEALLVFLILEGFCPRYTDSTGGFLHVAEDRSLSPGIFPPQTDAVCLGWDYQLIDIFRACKVVLKGIIGEG